MASRSTELALVRRFHAISQDYETRPSIARRNTLPVLSRFLTSNDREIQKICLQAVYLLSQHPDNVNLLGAETTLVEGIFHVYSEAQYNDPELYELSNLTLDALGPGLRDGDPRRTEVLRQAAEDISVSPVENSREPDPDSVGEIGSPLEMSYDTADAAVIKPTHASSGVTHMVTLEIPALHARTDTSDIEAILHKIKGIVSYTIAASVHQLRVFMSHPTLQPLQDALNNAGYVNLVLSNEQIKKQDGVRSNLYHKKSYYDEEEKRPSYLEDAKSFASNIYKAITVYTGKESNTLAARVRRHRELGNQSTNRVADRLKRRPLRQTD